MPDGYAEEANARTRRADSRAHLTLLVAAFLGLILAGLWAWDRYIYRTEFTVQDAPVPAYLGFSFVAGLVSFFAPCAFPMLPAYAGTYLATETAGTRRDAMRLGSACAAGVLGFFLVLGLLLSLVSPAIAPVLFLAPPVIGAVLVVAGLLLVKGFAWKPAGPAARLSALFARQERASTRFAVFGVAYGLASMGCTLPVLMAVFVGPFLLGDLSLSWAGFGLYAVAMAGMILVVTYLLARSRNTLLARMQGSTERIKKASGALLVVAGAYLIYYYYFVGTGVPFLST